jgi:hypothetical protein
MLQPIRRRTWAPRGETPIQKAWDRHDRLSNIAALSVSPVRHHLGLYFQLLPENVRNEHMLWFLTEMHRHFGRKIILIWDRSSVHRSAAAYFEKHHPDWFQFEWLPAYAPELNPVEQCWNHTKYADLSNFIPDNVGHLHDAVSGSIQDQQQNQPLLRSFFQTARLDLNSSQ